MGLRVVDASVVVDALSGRGERGLSAALQLKESDLAAPFHLDLEAMGAWRRHVQHDRLDPIAAGLALSELRQLRIKRYPHEPLLPRIWELRHNLTIADAAYVALSERLGVPLLTCDAKMARAPGSQCEFELIS